MHQPVEAIAATKDMKTEFRSRAVRMRSMAFGILGIIFLLLVGGATAFVLAPQITLSDFYPNSNIEKKLNDVNQEIAQLNKKIEDEKDATNNKYVAWSTPIYKNYDDVLKFLGKFTLPPVRHVDINIDSSCIVDKNKVLQWLASVSTQQESVFIQLANPPGVPDSLYEVTQDKLPRLKEDIAKISMPSGTPPPIKRDPNIDDERLDTLISAARILRSEKSQQEIGTILGRSPTNSKSENEAEKSTSRIVGDVPLAQLIQTNVTRFGTIIMITFLVSILTPLYRYNIRLATYYDARADVLELFDTKLKSVGFARLAATLTPSFDFGKAPTTPVEQLVELIKELSAKEKSHGKSE